MMPAHDATVTPEILAVGETVIDLVDRDG